MIPYTAELPLRRTTSWGAFAQPQAIPRRYGATAGEALPYNAERTQFVWSDGAVGGIDRVTVGGEQRGNWEAFTEIDRAGHPVALVEFGSPLAEGELPFCVGRGILSTRTGQVMTSSADIVDDIVRVLAGNPLDPNRLNTFRAETQGLICAGTLDGGTLQGAVRSICASVGAIYSPVHPHLCQLHPGSAYTGTVHTVDGADPEISISATVRRSDRISRLLLEFDVQDGQAQASAELVETSARFSRTSTLRMDWVADRRTALAVGARVLEYAARPRWVYSVSNLPGVVRVGDTLHITSRRVAGEGGVMARVLQVSADPRGLRSNVTGAVAWV